MREIDKDGRLALSRDEYAHFMRVFAAMNMIEISDESKMLEPRIRMNKSGWRTWRLMIWCMEQLMGQLLHTLPKQKLPIIRAELMNLRTYTYQNGACEGELPPDHILVPRDALNALSARVQTIACCMCTKTGKKCKRCDVRKEMTALAEWDIDTVTLEDGKELDCPFKWGDAADLLTGDYEEELTTDYEEVSP